MVKHLTKKKKNINIDSQILFLDFDLCFYKYCKFKLFSTFSMNFRKYMVLSM